ncbi:MAG: hypothetical protein JSS20_15355, partial [Proteobacteria bacterium]|nr:hypothetical protein [Pseudomonadota bacterium]
MRSGALFGAALGAVTLVPLATATAADCSRADFEAVVSMTAEALRQLNQANKPAFQAKLRELKVKRGWNQDQFLAEAAPIVQDPTIARYD